MRRAAPGRILAAALILGAILRLGAACFYFRTPISDGGDDKQYYDLADSIASGQGFLLHGRPSAYRAPLYPLALAAIMVVTGRREPGVVRVIQAFWSLLAIWIVYLIGRELKSARAGAAAALILALLPEQILLPTSLYLESFFSVLLLSAALAFMRWRKRPSPGGACLAGAALGVSLSARSTLALVPLMFPPRKLKEAACLLVFAVLPLTPWILRNELTFGKMIPFETGVAGPVIWYASRGYVAAPQDENHVEPMSTMFAKIPHTEWDRISLDLAVRQIVAEPGLYVTSGLRRVAALWTDSYTCYLLHDHQLLSGFMESGKHWEWIYWPDMIVRLFLVTAACFGFWRERKRPGVMVVAGFVVYFNLYALGTVFARFVSPVIPLLCVFAGLGITELFCNGRTLGAQSS
jgi:hypothetical protein